MPRLSPSRLCRAVKSAKRSALSNPFSPERRRHCHRLDHRSAPTAPAPLTIRLAPALAEALRRAASDTGETPESLAAAAVEEWLKRMGYLNQPTA